LNESAAEIRRLKNERNEMIENTNRLKETLAKHDSVVDDIKKTAADERIKLGDVIANLKSDVATSKAMNDALESQLRSRFTNEEFLSASIVDLEKNLADTKKLYDTGLKKWKEREQELESENSHAKKTVEDLTKRNVSMQSRVNDLNKQLSKLLASHSSLNVEYERLVESTSRAELEQIEETRNERERITALLQTQQQSFDAFMNDQRRILSDAAKKESETHASNLTERERSLAEIDKLKEEFKQAHLAERERKLKEANRQKTEVGKFSAASRSKNSNVLRHARASPSPTPSSSVSSKKSSGSVVAGAASGGGSPTPGGSSGRRERERERRQSPATVSSSQRRKGGGGSSQQSSSVVPIPPPSPQSTIYDSYPETPIKRKGSGARGKNDKSSGGGSGGGQRSALINSISPPTTPFSPTESDLGPIGAGNLMRLLEDRAENKGRSFGGPGLGDYPGVGGGGGGGSVLSEISASPGKPSRNRDLRSYADDMYSVNDETSTGSSSVAYGYRSILRDAAPPGRPIGGAGLGPIYDVRQDSHFEGSEAEF